MKKLSKNEWVAVGVSLVIIAVLVVFTSTFATPRNTDIASQEQIQDQTMPQEITDQNPIDPAFKSVDVVVGTGAEAQPGKLVAVHYTGKLQDGTVFDSSLARGTPFEFPLGQGMVIAGWEEGVKGMKIGGKRTLTIPAAMGYGSQDVTDPSGKVIIPANSTLFFDVELIGVK